MQPRILVNRGESSFTFYAPSSRSFVLSSLSLARAQKRAEYVAVIDATTKPAHRRWADERIARRILSVATPAELATVKAANVMVVTDDGIAPLSDAAPIASPVAAPSFLRQRFPGMFPPPKSGEPAEEPENGGGEGGEKGAAGAEPPAGKQSSDVTDPSPANPAPTGAVSREALAKAKRNFYAWRNQAWRRTAMNDLVVGDRVKIREHSGEYVADEHGNVEFTVTKAMHATEDGNNAIGTEPYQPPEPERRAAGPTSRPQIPAVRTREKSPKNRRRAEGIAG